MATIAPTAPEIVLAGLTDGISLGPPTRRPVKYAPVSLAHHLAHLQPLTDSHQALVGFDLVTEPDGETRHAGVDAYGNPCLWFSRALPHDRLLVRTTSRVPGRSSSCCALSSCSGPHFSARGSEAKSWPCR